MNKTIKYFYLDDSPIYRGKNIIRMDLNLFLFPHGTTGSYGVFIARLLNMKYADYLRYCRDVLGAELIGKNKRYIIPYFEGTEAVRQFIRFLNARMRYVMNEQEFPYDYKVEENGIVRIPFNKNESNNGDDGEV